MTASSERSLWFCLVNQTGWYRPTSAVSVSDVMSPAVARFGQTAVLWRRGRDVVSRTAADEPPSAWLAGPETGASLGFLYEDLRERNQKIQSGPV